MELMILRAHRWWQRAGGLLLHAPLQAQEGLLIQPCNSVHTCFMRYAIDVVFLDRQARVLSIVSSLRPWRMAVNWRAHQVLELRAGVAAQQDLKPGVLIDLE